MPPATKIGTSAASGGNISWASTEVETGPIWPPASIPSMTSASTPERISFLASASAGAKQISLAPLALIRSIAPGGGRPPARTTWLTSWLRADVDQLDQHRVHGDQIDAERPVGALLGLGDLGVEQIGRHRAAGDHPERAGIGQSRDEVALRDPAHRAAEDRDLAAEEVGAALHQPRRGGRGRSCDVATSLTLLILRIEPVGGVEHAHRELGIFLGDQHRDLDLRGGDGEDVDAAVGERLEHRRGDAGIGAHADADRADLDDVGVGEDLGRSRPSRCAFSSTVDGCGRATAVGHGEGEVALLAARAARSGRSCRH